MPSSAVSMRTCYEHAESTSSSLDSKQAVGHMAASPPGILEHTYTVCLVNVIQKAPLAVGLPPRPEVSLLPLCHASVVFGLADAVAAAVQVVSEGGRLNEGLPPILLAIVQVRVRLELPALTLCLIWPAPLVHVLVPAPRVTRAATAMARILARVKARLARLVAAEIHRVALRSVLRITPNRRIQATRMRAFRLSLRSQPLLQLQVDVASINLYLVQSPLDAGEACSRHQDRLRTVPDASGLVLDRAPTHPNQIAHAPARAHGRDPHHVGHILREAAVRQRLVSVAARSLA